TCGSCSRALVCPTRHDHGDREPSPGTRRTVPQADTCTATRHDLVRATSPTPCPHRPPSSARSPPVRPRRPLIQPAMRTVYSPHSLLGHATALPSSPGARMTSPSVSSAIARHSSLNLLGLPRLYRVAASMPCWFFPPYTSAPVHVLQVYPRHRADTNFEATHIYWPSSFASSSRPVRSAGLLGGVPPPRTPAPPQADSRPASGGGFAPKPLVCSSDCTLAVAPFEPAHHEVRTRHPLGHQWRPTRRASSRLGG